MAVFLCRDNRIAWIFTSALTLTFVLLKPLFKKITEVFNGIYRKYLCAVVLMMLTAK